MINQWHLKNFLTTDTCTVDSVYSLWEQADELKKEVLQNGGNQVLHHKILAALFFEPSSRTFSSFISAMQRLGGGIIPLNGMSNTSVVKGETEADSARVFSSYADVIVMRHTTPGNVALFAKTSSVPVINAGDGWGEHPTQALLDAYTIHKHFPDFSKITVGLIGDLKYGRTVHSLAPLLATLGVKQFILVSPSALKMQKEVTDKFQKKAASQEVEDLQSVIREIDVVYMTRIQKERFPDVAEYQKYQNAYVLNSEGMKKVKKTAIVMHPLPRVHEIHPEIDSDPRCLYFSEQMRNGMYVRMALLKKILLP